MVYISIMSRKKRLSQRKNTIQNINIIKEDLLL